MPASNTVEVVQYGIDIDRLLHIIFSFIPGLSGSSTSIGASDSIYAFVVVCWWIFSILAYIASIGFMFAIIYTKMRLHELEHLQEHQIHEVEHQYAHDQHTHSKNAKWENALHHTESDNPNDWRLAIIEADIMLEDVLNTLGYGGISIGDKLKQASPQFFKSLDDAWKAHRVRNDIAHKGSDFILTKRLAKETIEQYRRVFDEFHII